MPKPKQARAPDTRLDDARTGVDAALAILSAELERQIILAMWRIAKHNSHREIFFQCSGGVWDFRIGAENYGLVFGLGSSKADPPVASMLEQTLLDYGLRALPNVTLSIKHNKIKRTTT